MGRAATQDSTYREPDTEGAPKLGTKLGTKLSAKLGAKSGANSDGGWVSVTAGFSVPRTPAFFAAMDISAEATVPAAYSDKPGGAELSLTLAAAKLVVEQLRAEDRALLSDTDLLSETAPGEDVLGEGVKAQPSGPDSVLLALYQDVMGRWDMVWPANPPAGLSEAEREAQATETAMMKSRMIRMVAQTPAGLLAKLSLIPENADFDELDPALGNDATVLSLRDDLLRLSGHTASIS